MLGLLPPSSQEVTGYFQLGQAIALLGMNEKQAAEATVCRDLTGKLYLSKSGWLLLSVPNGLARGAFDALQAVGAELPKKNTDDPNSTFNAHISVMSADEVASIGADKITERGHDFHYTTGQLKTCKPEGWDGVSQVWFITVDSPELRNLRKSYGLEPLRKGFDHHITIAIKRTGVTGNNGVSKFDVNTDREQSETHVKFSWDRGDHPTFSPAPANVADLPAVFAKIAAYKDELLAKLEAARKATEPNPTEAQKKSGNYAKGRLSLHGLPLTIETSKGTYRRGTSPAGKAWATLMQDDYGYIRNTLSEADGDHVDVFIGPDVDSYMVYIVDQNDPGTGKFDEHKCVLGCRTKAQAEEVYKRNYEAGWKGFGGIKSMHLNEFKFWLASGDTGSAAQ